MRRRNRLRPEQCSAIFHTEWIMKLGEERSMTAINDGNLSDVKEAARSAIQLYTERWQANSCHRYFKTIDVLRAQRILKDVMCNLREDQGVGG
jgi:hypothetical protein